MKSSDRGAHYLISSSPSYAHVTLSTLFSFTLIQYYSLNVGDQVSHPYPTPNIIIIGSALTQGRTWPMWFQYRRCLDATSCLPLCRQCELLTYANHRSHCIFISSWGFTLTIADGKGFTLRTILPALGESWAGGWGKFLSSWVVNLRCY